MTSGHALTAGSSLHHGLLLRLTDRSAEEHLVEDRASRYPVCLAAEGWEGANLDKTARLALLVDAIAITGATIGGGRLRTQTQALRGRLAPWIATLGHAD